MTDEQCEMCKQKTYPPLGTTKLVLMEGQRICYDCLADYYSLFAAPQTFIPYNGQVNPQSEAEFWSIKTSMSNYERKKNES